jgi:protoporphyrinogen oxidase
MLHNADVFEPSLRRGARSPSSGTGERVAVLGAGPMGLAVAYQLLERGRHPIVFEADDRVGGMTACFDFSGLSIERFYHFHCTSDHAFLQLIEKLGIGSRMHWVSTKMGFWYGGRVQPWGNPIALLGFSGLGLASKLRYGLHAFLATKRKDWSALDRIEATGWIRRWVGEEAFEVLWRRLFELKFYDYAETLSAAWIWSRIRRIGRSRYDLFREKLGYLEGGSDTFLAALRAHIETRGGEIRLRSPVSRVAIEDGELRGVVVGEELQPFSKVISTVPLPFVPRLMPGLPEALLARYRALQNIGVVCVIVKLKKPLTGNFWLNVNDPEMDIPGLVEYSNLRPLDAHVVYVPFYMPGEHPKFQEPDEAFHQRVRTYLRRINPELRDEDFLDIRASRYRHAQPICTPRFLERLPDARLPVNGLWAADTSHYYPEDRGISESIAFGRQLADRALA